MNVKTILLLFILTTGLLSAQLHAQSAGDYRSNPALLSTTWTSPGNWQRYNGSMWVPASAFPTSADGVITIRSPHTIDLGSAITIDQVVVASGGGLNINVLLGTFTVTLNDGVGTDLQVSGSFSIGAGGTLTGSGSIQNNSAGSITVGVGGTVSGNVSIQNNSGGTMALNGGTLGGTTTNSGTITMNSLLISSTITGTLTNNGTLSHAFNTVTLNNGGSIVNNATFNFPTGLATTTINNAAGAASVINSPTGTMTTVATAVAIVDVGVSFTNQGTLRGVGEFRVLGTSITNSGTIEPGTASAGSLRINPLLVTNKPNTYSIDIVSTGNVAGNTYDEVVISNQGGTATILSSSILRMTDQALDPVGTIYTIIRTASSTLTGPFASVVLSPTLGNLTINSTTVTVEKIAAGRHWVGSYLYQNNFSTTTELNQWTLVEDNGTGSWGLSGNGTAILRMDNAAGAYANRLFHQTAGVPSRYPLDRVNGVVEFQVLALTGGTQQFFVQVEEFNATNTYLGQQTILSGQSTTGFFTITLSSFTWNAATTQIRFIIGGANFSAQQGTIEFNYFKYTNTQQNWNNSANWSATTGGTGGAGVPTATSVVYFDAVRNANCTIDVAPTVSGWVVNSGYTGMILHTTNVITISNAAQWSGGTFSGGSGDIVVGGLFTLDGTLFTSTSGVLELRHSVAFTSGSFAHHNGTLRFNATNVTSPVITGTSPALYNLEWVGLAKTYTLPSGTMIVANALTLSGSGALTLNTGTIAVSGNVVNNNTGTGGGGSTLLTLTGTGVQALSGRSVAGQGAYPPVTINKASGSVNLTNIVTVAGSWSQLAGSVSAGSSTLRVTGHFTCNTAFSAGSGTVVLFGTSIQDVTSTAVITFHHLTVNNTAGVRLQSSQNLEGVLTLGAGAQLDADGTSNTSIFTLLSTADSPVQDAAVAALPSGALISGNVTVQRYMSLEGVNGSLYRYIAMPIQAATVADLQQELPVNGPFPGASTCSTCVPNAHSLFYYDETVITNINGDQLNDLNDGYRGFPTTSTAETFQPGRGYALYVYGTDLSTARWDVRGPLTHGNVTAVSMPVTFTSSGTMANDGWNLVGNPYACVIDWNGTGWTKTNMDASIYIRDNGATPHRFATWNGTVGTNGGSRYIALGQGFWVKSNAAAPVLSANEQVKVTGQSPNFFRQQSSENIVRVTLQRGQDRDELVIHFRDDATHAFDAHADALKLASPSFDLSAVSDTQLLAIHSLPVPSDLETVNLNMERLSTGTYELAFTHSLHDGLPIRLVDRYSQDTMAIERDDRYEFSVSDLSSSARDRFVLLIGTPAVVTAVTIPSLAIFPNPTSGQVDLRVSSDLHLERVEVYSPTGVMIGLVSIQHDGTDATGSFSLHDAVPGVYVVRLITSAGNFVRKVIRK